jgi:hypothetical protein
VTDHPGSVAKADYVRRIALSEEWPPLAIEAQGGTNETS